MRGKRELWDVVIVGAGPAGSTAAALLAHQGWRVLVAEKDTFPRFHIGESLLPAAKGVLDSLGVEPATESYCFKRGAQFVDEASGRVAAFDFAKALPGPPRHAWHVERAAFDTQLRDLARQRGAEVRHGVRVSDFTVDEDAVTVCADSGIERARYLVDATGQDRLVARRSRAVKPYACFGKAAAFTHYHGVGEVALQQLGEGNDIRVMVVDGGWAWVIPLTRNRLSIGLVRHRGTMRADDVLAYVGTSAWLSSLTRGAEAAQTRIVSNFSYRNAQPQGPRFACVGDAACFIDPVFSSGVSVAMIGASALADRLGAALAAGKEAQADLMVPLSRQMGRAYNTFAALVYRFYHTRFVDHVIFGAPEEEGSFRSSVISVFAGDVLRQDNAFANMLLASRRYPWDKDRAGPTLVTGLKTLSASQEKLL